MHPRSLSARIAVAQWRCANGAVWMAALLISGDTVPTSIYNVRDVQPPPITQNPDRKQQIAFGDLVKPQVLKLRLSEKFLRLLNGLQFRSSE
jgi:hypothetical protein